MLITEHHSLRQYNTFGIDVKARYFVEVTRVEELREVLNDERFRNIQKLILGGGSNILFTNDYEGLVIKISIKGITIEKESDDKVWIKANAGEVWHEFVLYCLEHAFFGLENLSLIPGQVGAAPMQNIGAYGVEIKQVFDHLEALNIENGNIESFDLDTCHFGYRESIFKNTHKGKYIILSVTFHLTKKPDTNTSYGAISETLEKMQISSPTPKDVSNAVIAIRSSKLPDPKKLGNAGSFFKNPEISMEQFHVFIEKFPNAPHYKVNEQSMKIPAGWLIEQCGWKGKVVGNTGSHKDQALVLVNYGHANGNEIWSLAMEIKRSVKEKFEIDIEAEVNIV